MKNKLYLKLLSFLLVVSVLIAQFSVGAITISSSDRNHDRITQSYKNFVAIELYSFLQDNAGNISVFGDDYAGAFIDENDVLNVCILDSVNMKHYEKILGKENIKNISSELLKEMISKDDAFMSDTLASLEDTSNNITIKYKVSKFSLKYLTEIENALKPNMSKLGIQVLFIDQSDNLVYIYVSNRECIEKVNEFLSNRIKGYDTTAVKYVIEELNITTTATYYAYGGRLATSSAGNWTVGFNAKDSNGNFGVVTCGHAVSLGDSVYNEDNKKIGTVANRSHGSTIDASFIPFSNTLFVKWQETQYVSYPNSSIYPNISSVATSNQFVEGARVERYGIATDKTVGTIVTPNVNINGGSANPSYTNAFLYSNAPDIGDSGGPILLSTGTPKSLRYLAGINSAYIDFTDIGRLGIGSKAPDILSSFSLTAVTSENCLY